MLRRVIAKSLSALAFAAALALLAVTPATAFERADFTDAAFKAAQAAGKSVVVDVFAPWCPTCKAQQEVFEELRNKPEFAGVIIMKVDFDSQKDVLRSFKAQSQSTLIAFKGTRETGRSAGETDTRKIEALISTTVK